MPTDTTTTTKTTTETTVITTISPNNNSNWDKKVIGTGFFIILFTSGLIFCFVSAFKKIESEKSIVAVAWPASDTTNLEPGPSWFYYNSNSKMLQVNKQVNDIDKLKLLSLGDKLTLERNSYKNAINELSFKSKKELQSQYLFILWLTAISGALGVQLRTINNFIGVTCKKNEFNFDVWWPWYFVRPIIGCLIGPVVYIIFEGKLITFASDITYSKVLAIAVCVLAGFGAEDVLNTLRSLSKKIFGYKEER